MDDLISKLEKAIKPDRDLDRQIAQSLETLATDPFQGPSAWEMHRGMYWVFGKKDTKDGTVIEKWSKSAPLYTSSIDNALTLIPKEKAWALWGSGGSYSARIYISGGGWIDDTDVGVGTSPLPSIALCIASLKAKASLREAS